MLHSNSLKRKKSIVSQKKENKNTEPVFKIKSMVSIKYSNHLVMAHCNLTMIKQLSSKELTVHRTKWRNFLLLEKKKCSFTSNFLVLLKLKNRNRPPLPITYTKPGNATAESEVNRGCIKLGNAVSGFSSSLVCSKNRHVVCEEPAPQARGEARARGRRVTKRCLWKPTSSQVLSGFWHSGKPETRVTEDCEVLHACETFFHSVFLRFSKVLLIYSGFQQINFFWY